MEAIKLPSKYQIYDDIEVLIPGEELMVNTDQHIPNDALISGIVVAVRFTRGKVFYDILNDMSADVFRDIDSNFVIDPKETSRIIAQA